LLGGGDFEVGVIRLVVLDRLLRATTKKVVNFFEEKVHPRQNPSYAYVRCLTIAKISVKTCQRRESGGLA